MADVADTLLFRAHATSDPDFGFFADKPTDGEDSRLTLGWDWVGTSTGGFVTPFESSWFASVLPDGQVVFAGADITAISLRVFNLSDVLNNQSPGLGFNYQLIIEGELTPVPLPGGG